MSIVRNLFNLNKNYYNKKFITNNLYFGIRQKSTTQLTKEDEEEELNKPIKYTTSKAFNWKAKTSLRGPESNRLWYEPIVVLGSVAVFLIYFTMLREENDIDEELTKPLISRVEGLEEVQLRMALKYNLEHGLPTDELLEKLQRFENKSDK